MVMQIKIEGDFLGLGIVSLLIISIVEIGFWVYICSKISRKLSTIMISNSYEKMRDKDESK